MSSNVYIGGSGECNFAYVNEEQWIMKNEEQWIMKNEE